MPRTELGASAFFLPVTPDDTNALSYQTRALYIGTGGDVEVRAQDNPDTAIVFYNVSNGTVLDIAVSHVYNTNTTASNIIALV